MKYKIEIPIVFYLSKQTDISAAVVNMKMFIKEFNEVSLTAKKFGAKAVKKAYKISKV